MSERAVVRRQIHDAGLANAFRPIPRVGSFYVWKRVKTPYLYDALFDNVDR